MKGKKKDFTTFIYPIGLTLGIILGLIIKNGAMGVAIGAILGCIVTFAVRFLKMPKDKENKRMKINSSANSNLKG